MNISSHNINEKAFENDIRFESNVSKTSSIMFVGLFLEDLIVRIGFLRQDPVPFLILLQGFLCLLYLIVSMINLSDIKRDNSKRKNNDVINQRIKVATIAAYVATMYHGEFFYFFAFAPIMLISIYNGFKKAIPYTVLSWITQFVFKVFMHIWLGSSSAPGIFADNNVIFGINAFQYIMFLFIAYICGQIHNEYMKRQEENNILIDRLGDKYVQIEQAKKDIQTHCNKIIQTNDQLEEINSKLESNVAEFYTLQQISQAITSIFDMRELLKFVNDVIIGVLGAYHSTIALCSGSQNRLKVQVSSIYNNKDLAILSDYINCDALKPAIINGESMIDKSVTSDAYPFTKGRNIRTLICVPLLVKGKSIGVVLIEHWVEDAFDSDNMRLLEIIAQQVSIAIENARLYQQMQDLATLDGLTGAYNRIYFQDSLEIEYMKAKQNDYDLSLIIFDIDYFKRFNDNYGHLFGDLVLKSISAYISDNIRKEDVFARYGGEEFVVLMPHTTLQQAKEKAEDLRQGISNLTITDRFVTVSVTISVGVSSFPLSAGRPTELIKTSDDALYEAKRDGRNVVRLARIRAS